MKLKLYCRKIYKIIKAPIDFAYSRLFPEKFAKHIGVNAKGFFRVFGKVNWGTEPWIITHGENVYITNNVAFVTHDGGTLLFRKYQPDLEITKPIVIGNDVYIGMNSMIMPGVTIGDKCIIGAGSIVTKDIPGNSVAVGVPARVIKTADEYYEKIKKESLKLGHLVGKEKDIALRKYYGYEKGKVGGINNAKT